MMMTLGPNVLFWRSSGKFLDLPAGANLVIHQDCSRASGVQGGGCKILFVEKSSRCNQVVIRTSPRHRGNYGNLQELPVPLGFVCRLSLLGESQGVFCCACLAFSGRASPACKVGATSASWFGRLYQDPQEGFTHFDGTSHAFDRHSLWSQVPERLVNVARDGPSRRELVRYEDHEPPRPPGGSNKIDPPILDSNTPMWSIDAGM